MTDFEKAQREGYKIEKYGECSNWFVVDNFGTCYGYYKTEGEAKRAMEKIGGSYK